MCTMSASSSLWIPFTAESSLFPLTSKKASQPGVRAVAGQVAGRRRAGDGPGRVRAMERDCAIRSAPDGGEKRPLFLSHMGHGFRRGGAGRGCRAHREKATRGPLTLCHNLCHNPAIPARVGPYRRVSLTHRQRAAKMRRNRINTALSHHSMSLSLSPSQLTRGIDTEEVDGSSPFGPTMSPAGSVT